MKILLFANTDWYLYNFRRSLAEALKEAGHEVLLVAPAGPYSEKLRSKGFRFVAAPMERRSLNPMRELSLLFWLRRLIRRERLSLVHGFTLKCAVYGSLASRLEGKAARVASVAGLGYVFINNELRARILRPLVRTLLRVALGGDKIRLILQNSDDIESFKQVRLLDPAVVRLIQGSGVNCQRFIPLGKDERTDSGETLRVVLAARLLWDKGLAEYIAAAREIRGKGLPIEFFLVGAPDPGNPASVTEKQVRAWAEEGVIEWLGHRDDMPDLLQTVDIAVLPSYREGLPKGLIEAAACGLPIVTTDVPGCREVVTDGVDGLLVPVRDVVALSDAIERLCRDEDLRGRLGAAARKKALLRFDEQIVISQTLAVYDELVPNL